MSTRLKEKEEKILEIIEKLKEQSKKGTPIIVEGKKDIETLTVLGVEGKILTAKTGGKSFLDVVSEIEKSNTKEVILLLDFDRRGKEGTKRIKRSLEQARIKPNMKFWRELSSLLGKDVKDIESLTSYMETLKSKISNS